MEILTNVVVNEFSYWQQIIHDHLMILHHTREILLEDLVDALERKDTNSEWLSLELLHQMSRAFKVHILEAKFPSQP